MKFRHLPEKLQCGFFPPHLTGRDNTVFVLHHITLHAIRLHCIFAEYLAWTCAHLCIAKIEIILVIEQHLPVHAVYVLFVCPYEKDRQCHDHLGCFFSQVTAGGTLTCGVPRAVKWSISVIQIMYFRAGREFMDSCSIGNIHHPMHCSSLLCCCDLHGWHPLHIQPSWREGSLLCVFFQGVSSLSLFRVFFGGGVPFTRFEVPFERNCTCDNEV